MKGKAMNLEVISRKPALSPKLTPLLFIHGAWHGPWCWEEHFLDYFAANGYPVYALSLRGHGASQGRDRLRWTRLADYVADVEQVASGLSNPPVLIGHSMGGAVVQKYLEAHSAPAGILLAAVPPSGIGASSIRIARRHPLLISKVLLSFSTYPIISTPVLAREAFFSQGMSDENVHRFFNRFQDESYLAFLDMMILDLPKPKRISSPLLVLGAANDTMIEKREIEATARAYNTNAIIFPDMGHDMMLEHGWQKVADSILEWMDRKLVL
jgi:pimeloyl-ACP methyl ester carboxylesterase